MRRIADEDVWACALTLEKTCGDGRRWRSHVEHIYDWHNQPFMPVEFSVAAYRFGHSMVRNAYQTIQPQLIHCTAQPRGSVFARMPGRLIRAAPIAVLLVLAGAQLQQRWTQSAEVDSTITLAIGDTLPGSLYVRSLGADTEPVPLRDVLATPCTYVHVFEPSCPACISSAERWRQAALEAGLNSSQIPILWWSLSAATDSVSRFVTAYDVAWPVVVSETSVSIGEAGIGAVPGVWGIRDGRIHFRRTGASTVTYSLLEASTQWCDDG